LEAISNCLAKPLPDCTLIPFARRRKQTLRWAYHLSVTHSTPPLLYPSRALSLLNFEQPPLHRDQGSRLQCRAASVGWPAEPAAGSGRP
jgi:hypothetical protein